MAIVTVKLWGKEVGVVIWNNDKQTAVFEFFDDFVKLDINIAPLLMPIEDLQRGERIFSFDRLNKDTFQGLPGLLSDSLPDAYGNQVIRSWLASQGRNVASLSPVEKLSYIGQRGMGALEFEPTNHPHDSTEDMELQNLIELANKVLDEKTKLNLQLNKDEEKTLNDLIKVGTSAGGQRPKAIIAYNPKTREIKSGQIKAPRGFDYYILKFDGVESGGLGDPKGFGRIEMAYHKMAVDCGILMNDCQLLEENGRAHFMTKRFDRFKGGEKVHMQTLCAIAHYDYRSAGAYSYEDAFAEMRDLELPYTDFDQQFRRMVFNVIARNQDDHTKNISFLLRKKGEWRLSPAYDVSWSYNPKGDWTNMHQMSINGKRDDFVLNDLLNFASNQGVNKAREIIEQCISVVANWNDYAIEFEVDINRISLIAKTHRLKL